jgi:hypothetical protein
MKASDTHRWIGSSSVTDVPLSAILFHSRWCKIPGQINCGTHHPANIVSVRLQSFNSRKLCAGSLYTSINDASIVAFASV